MNRISEITKRDIQDIFINGIDIPVFWDTETVTYNYYGRIEELEFLKRLYDLKNLPSTDSRYENSEGDIWQHTVNNEDYPSCWVFEDDRFQLKNGSDEVYLKFICEIFHPTVRFERGYWREFLNEINKLLRNDHYELYPSGKISNHDVYGWRIYYPEEEQFFIPYSQRNKNGIKENNSIIPLKPSARNQIYQLLERFNSVNEKQYNGFNTTVTTSQEVFNDIRQFYLPKCYNKRHYIETNSLESFILHSKPKCVFDAIEFFEKYNQSNDFEAQINLIFKLNGISFKLDNGKIVSLFDSQIQSSTNTPIQETGLKELLQDAAKYYDEGNVKIAVEKLWDAFERLKTYYFPSLDKKKSTEKIITAMSTGNDYYKELFDKEFKELTTIGNSYTIRHHETSKIHIEDKRHYDYFYKRCLSLISIALQYLNI